MHRECYIDQRETRSLRAKRAIRDTDRVFIREPAIASSQAYFRQRRVLCESSGNPKMSNQGHSLYSLNEMDHSQVCIQWHMLSILRDGTAFNTSDTYL